MRQIPLDLTYASDGTMLPSKNTLRKAIIQGDGTSGTVSFLLNHARAKEGGNLSNDPAILGG